MEDFTEKALSNTVAEPFGNPVSRRVSMLVYNEFIHDSRVLKEAQTLANVGFRVFVFALHKPGMTRLREKLDSHIDVIRVARNPFSYVLFRGWYSQNVVITHPTKYRARKCSKRLSLLGKAICRSVTHLVLLYKLVRSKPDFIHAHDVNTLPTAWLASVICRVPLIYDAHEISVDREGYREIRKYVGWLEKQLMPRVAATITTTDLRATFLARAYKVARPIVLQNRPRLTCIKKTNKIRQELGLIEDWPIILYQGGIQIGRGLELVIDAARKVKNAYFVFIGNGQIEMLLKNMVVEFDLQHKCFFISTVPLKKLSLYTASADIGLQPIENTCFNHFSTDSNKLFEYVMAGLPVIASDMPTIRKIVNEYKFGILIEPGCPEQLSGALSKLINDKKLRRKLSHNASLARETLNWESEESKLLDIYDNIKG